MKLPWSRAPEPLYMPASTVGPVVIAREPPPEPDDEGDVLWERSDQPMDLMDRLRITHQDMAARRLRLPWTTSSPTQAGLYWWRPYPLRELPTDLAALELVLSYGGRLVIAIKSNATTNFRSLSVLPPREWAGPIGVPEGMDLDKWWGIELLGND
jgi:hypothetical protein